MRMHMGRSMLALSRGARAVLGASALLVATGCVEWHQTVASDRPTIANYISAVSAANGIATAALRSGAPQGGSGAPVVTAPIPGQLGLRQVDQGNIVRSGDAAGIVVITQTKPISVLFTIPQDSLQTVLKRLKSGEKIPVEAYDREQKTRLASGRLLTADNQIDTTTGTIKLKAEFPNDENLLFPNQFVNIRMLVDTREDAITVPTSAIQRGAQGLFVYVLNDDQTVSLRAVKTGVTEGTRIEIESGVKPRERVVIDGMDRLRDGMKVEVAERRALEGDGKGKGRGKRH